MKKLIYILIALTFAGLFVSCESTKEIPQDYSAAQIIQLGQNAYEAADYSDSEYYYKAVLERFGTEPATYVEAKYELGHIYMKTKKYDQAKACFNEILDIYNSDPYGTLPGAYKKLSQLGLEKISE